MLTRLIREDKLLEKFPQRTETDLYLWITDRLYDLRRLYGDEVEPEAAVEDFVRHHAKASVFDAVRQRITSARPKHEGKA